MPTTSPLGVLLALAIYGFIGLVVASSRLPRSIRIIIYLALALRIVGSLARFWMITEYYGRGDAIEYFEFGQRYAGMLWDRDFEALLDPTDWRGGRWWGTQFTQYFSGLVIAFVGPTIMGGFYIFALLSLIGLAGFGWAFRTAYPHVPVEHYLRWVFFFPSLWFWPASMGKEALTIFGLGLATAGFIWRRGRINWILLAVGIAMIFAVRPHTAAAVILAMVLAQWLGAEERWTPRRVVQGVMVLGAGAAVMFFALSSLGVESMDVEGIQGYMETLPGRRIDTGTNVAVGAVGVAGIPVAVVNILLRPFPFEAGSVAMLMASVEIWSLWFCVVLYRKRVVAAVKEWRYNRMLRFALPFIAIYTIMLGMSTGNLGILARQRIFLFPMLLILLAAAPEKAPVPASAPPRVRPVPRPQLRRLRSAP